MSDTTTWTGWAIVEIMGHRKVAGKAMSPGGPGALGGMLRIDAYDGEGEEFTTQFYGSAAIFSLTPTTEEVCRRLGQAWHNPPPVAPWELRLPESFDCGACGTTLPSGGACPTCDGEGEDLNGGDEDGSF